MFYTRLILSDLQEKSMMAICHKPIDSQRLKEFNIYQKGLFNDI